MFYLDLERFGSTEALVLDDACPISYSNLANLADDAVLGIPRPSLVIVEMRNELPAIAAYLGALRRGCPVILASPASASTLANPFGPAMQYAKLDGTWAWSGRTNAANDLHPDLALLLSTSGSTGSAKLARLSKQAINANAKSIAQYLHIEPTDRAVTSLPLHYSYGLSILNSHLAVGASVYLTDRSVIDPSFWTSFRSHGCTSFAGVPYSYELLERLQFRSDPPPTLKTMTQAGGRLGPEMVREYARWAKQRDLKFFTMYGQTEATARIAFLEPHLAEQFPDCIGGAVPGGELSIINDELIYRGPNVMMGYATSRSDLSKGSELSELATGDLAQEAAPGIFRIIGRKSRFSKIAGKRIALDEVESLCGHLGCTSTVAGNDELIALWAHDTSPKPSIEKQIEERLELPPHSVILAGQGEPPRLESGKIDYTAILAAAKKVHSHSHESQGNLAEKIAQTLGRHSIDQDLSFEELGADSLAYVHASMIVESHLGFLPERWESTPIRSLGILLKSDKVRNYIPVDIAIRLIALLFVMIGHASPENTNFLRGGALVLFFISGYSFSRFQFENISNTNLTDIIKQLTINLIAPYAIIATPIAIASNDIENVVPWITLTSVFYVNERGPLFAFWFIETIVHCQIISIIFFTFIKSFNIFEKKYTVSCILFYLISLLLLIFTRTPDNPEIHLTLDGWLWAFVLGCMVKSVEGKAGKLLLVFAGITTAWLTFPAGDLRWIWLAIAMILVCFFKTILAPSELSKILLKLSSASYFIYLTHVPTVHFIRFVYHFTGIQSIIAVVAISSVAGLIYANIWRRLVVAIIYRKGHQGPGLSRQDQ